MVDFYWVIYQLVPMDALSFRTFPSLLGVYSTYPQQWLLGATFLVPFRCRLSNTVSRLKGFFLGGAQTMDYRSFRGLDKKKHSSIFWKVCWSPIFGAVRYSSSPQIPGHGSSRITTFQHDCFPKSPLARHFPSN